MIRYLSLLLVGIGFISATSVLAQDRVSTSAGVKAKNVELIEYELRNCPCWNIVSPKDVGTRRTITNIYLKLSVYNTPTLRAGIEKLIKETGITFDNDTRIFAFLRVLFKMPSHYVITGKPLTLMGNPFHDDGSVDLLWPYSVDDAGHLVLTGGDGEFSFFGGFLWDELADFDNAASRFPRRPVKIQVINSSSQR